MTTAPRIAVLGAGRVGSALARATTEAGYSVSVSASGSPEDLDLIASVVMPGATPMWTGDAITAGDVVVLALPLHRFPALDPALFAGKIVVDSMNYWPPIDGRQDFFERGDTGSSEIVQEHLTRADVVKTFNHLGYHEIEADRRPAGDPNRRALGVAGDDHRAVELVASIVDSIGFDPVTFDSLRHGRAFQPGEPIFGTPLTRPRFLDLVSDRAAA
ncbi:NADPH-dependent F420 reductase [Streptomyces sp. 35G-GA-8]|uniref:NADPH-dependent F420 reductase n=1 Tax=Streptomyces sp. 35G-GA-8 TaxID=2939434 RepID=UPI00201F78C9|nr:NADPH-dependent F420 reductase [Streptomyces sp. 35G-GA-8]MCL7382604.1 NADPH-dependent F420 reductase [Streptomyces sp. 35G-GA-8]